MIFSLHPDQVVLVNQYIEDLNFCLCGAALTPSEDKGLLAQPMSSKARQEVSDSFQIMCVCQKCFVKFESLVEELRLKIPTLLKWRFLGFEFSVRLYV